MVLEEYFKQLTFMLENPKNLCSMEEIVKTIYKHLDSELFIYNAGATAQTAKAEMETLLWLGHRSENASFDSLSHLIKH